MLYSISSVQDKFEKGLFTLILNKDFQFQQFLCPDQSPPCGIGIGV